MNSAIQQVGDAGIPREEMTYVMREREVKEKGDRGKKKGRVRRAE